MSDFLRDCNSGALKTDPKTFRDTWCVRCSRPECDLAGFAKSDPMAIRNATWRERFFGTAKADLSIPKFARIASTDFPNLLQKAMKLEISERRGDWSVPEIPVLDGRVTPVPRDTTAHVDDAVQKLAGTTGRVWTPPEYPDETMAEDESETVEEVEAVEESPPPSHQPAPRVVQPQPATRNTPDPGEVVVGGGQVAPAAQQRPRPPAENDPWAPPPKPKVTVVKSGAKIQFGSGGKATVVDDK